MEDGSCTRLIDLLRCAHGIHELRYLEYIQLAFRSLYTVLSKLVLCYFNCVIYHDFLSCVHCSVHTGRVYARLNQMVTRKDKKFKNVSFELY
jgi:hypothetical protein